MNAIEKIIAQMNAQAQAERDALKSDEMKRIDDEFQANLAALEESKEKQLKKQYELLDTKYKQLRNRQQVEIRQNTLNEKQQFLRTLFQAAGDHMEQWDNESVQAFTVNALRGLSMTGDVLLIVGEKSQVALSADWVAAMNQKLPFTMTLSDEVLANQAGFILDDHGVQYNYVFRNLVQDVQGTMGFEIAKQLFD